MSLSPNKIVQSVASVLHRYYKFAHHLILNYLFNLLIPIYHVCLSYSQQEFLSFFSAEKILLVVATETFNFADILSYVIYGFAFIS